MYSIIFILHIRKQGHREENKMLSAFFMGQALHWTFAQQPVRFLPVPSDRGSLDRVQCVIGSDVASWGQSQAWSPGLSCILSFRASSGYPRLRFPVVRNGGQLGLGFRVAPGPQLSCFCSVLSLGPFVLLSNNNNNSNHNHPLRGQYFYTLFLI